MDDKYHELDKRIDLLEERMNTRYAESESALDRLRADMADWKTDMAKRDAEFAKREIDAGKRENRIVYAVFGAVGLGVAILGLLITGI